MIVRPLNDEACLGQLVERSRSWTNDKWFKATATRLGSLDALAAFIRSLPQTDDSGANRVGLRCDYTVRLRPHPADPNCVERSALYLALAEILDPARERTVRTFVVNTPSGQTRHVNVVERYVGTASAGWIPIDLFPVSTASPRNASAAEVLSDAKDVIHPIGKSLFQLFGGDAGARAADFLGGLEDQGIAEIRRGEGSPGPAKSGPAPAKSPRAATVDVYSRPAPKSSKRRARKSRRQ